jgi:hypothetical protein
METAANLVATLRQDPYWYTSFGLHSSADAINANFTTLDEQAAIFAQNFNDSVLICSYSPFNMYWILQVLCLTCMASVIMIAGARQHG